MKYEIPEGARSILGRLRATGYEAYLVGGCVRDLIRGAMPSDWDICTSALPEQTERCFQDHRVIQTGRKHGTVTVIFDGEPYEVTTYRTDGTYSDGRHPDGVHFVSSLQEDLARRDFTVNAIAMDAGGRLRDPFAGAADLAAGVIRCVGDADRRLQEDGLRVMRALRFAATLGLTIEGGTAAALHRNRHMLSRIAAERINTELSKLLTGGRAGTILRQYVDVLCEFWPELGAMVGFEQHNPWHCHDVWEHTVVAVEHAPGNLVIRLAVLLHDIGKPRCFSLDADGVGHFYGHAAAGVPLADDMLRRLKFDTHTREQVAALVANHDAVLEPRYKCVRRWLNKLGEERFTQLLEVKRADHMGQNRNMVRERLARLEEIRRKTDEVIAEKQCFTLRDLAVNGHDVMLAGVKPGPSVGRILDLLMERVMDGALPNERERLLREIRQCMVTQR